MEEVALLGCQGYEFEEVKHVIDEQFRILGIQKMIRDGMSVVIKPNLVMKAAPEKASITHPVVTAAVGCWMKEHGANVTIAESPGGMYTSVLLKSLYRETGYQEIAEKYGFHLNMDCSYREI